MKKSTIEFTLGEFPNEPVIIISSEGFYYKGQKIEDVHNVYNRFNEWLTEARKESNIMESK